VGVVVTPLAVEAAGLSFSYPDGTAVLKDVCLTIRQGESVAVMGPNGAGKSTLLLHLNGILRGAGRLSVLGLSMDNHNLRQIRQRVGLVFQDPDDQLFMARVSEDVAFGPSNMGLSRDEVTKRVAEALAAVSMEEAGDRVPHHLSLGQKKRVAIATVLAMRPDMLVLDEPLANLDPRARRQVIGILNELPITKIMATHDLAGACELCERVLLVDEGRVVADGLIEDILLDEVLLAAHDLEFPLGFAPELVLEAAEKGRLAVRAQWVRGRSEPGALEASRSRARHRAGRRLRP
jgi:cobalt transport protein ATP-binding subunit